MDSPPGGSVEFVRELNWQSTSASLICCPLSPRERWDYASVIRQRPESPARRRPAAAPGSELRSRRPFAPASPAPLEPLAACSTYWHKDRPLPKAVSAFRARRCDLDPAQ